MRYALLVAAVVAAAASFQHLLTWESGDVLDTGDVGQLVGAGLVPVAVGLLGLLYGRNRFLGFAAVTLIVTAILMVRALV